MGTHTSYAIDTKGPEANEEVKMVLSHPESVSRPNEKEVMSSPTENAETKEESSTTIAKADKSGEGSNKVRWLPSSSENESETEEEDSAGGDKKIDQVWEVLLEVVLPDLGYL